MAYALAQTITLDHTQCGTANSTNWPLAFVRTDLAYRTQANGGQVTNANGYDICFFSDSGLTTKLNWEVETYNGSTGAIVAWVQIPTLSYTADTVIYVGVGNSAITTFQGNVNSTWDSNFKGVWHFPNGSSLTLTDSTSNAVNGTNGGAVSAVAGQIDGGASFASASSTSNIDFGTSAATENLGKTSASTFSFWIDPLATHRGDVMGRNDNNTVAAGWTISLDDGTYMGSGGDQIVFIVESSTATMYVAVAAPTGSAWTKVDVVFDGSLTASNQKIYFNGVAQTHLSDSVNGSGTPGSDATQHLYMGYAYSGFTGQYFGGYLDEVKLSNTARSASWILASYNAEKSSSTFIKSVAANIGIGSISLSVATKALTATGAAGVTLGSETLTVAPKAPTPTGAANTTLGSETLSISPQAPTPSGAANTTLGSESLSVTTEAVAAGVAANVTLSSIPITVTTEAPAATGAANATLGSIPLTIAPQALAATGGATVTLSAQTLTVTTEALIAGVDGLVTLSAIGLTVAPQAPAASGAAAVTLAAEALAVTLEALAATGTIAVGIGSIALAVTTEAPAATGAANITPGSISMTVALEALTAAPSAVAILGSIALTVALESLLAAVSSYYTAMTCETDLTQIRNLVVGGSGTVQAIQTDTFTADGLTIFWPLSDVPDTSITAPSMTAGGVLRTVATGSPGSINAPYGIVTLGTGAAALAAGTDGVPPSGTVLSVTYAYQLPIRVAQQDAASQALAAALPSWGLLAYDLTNGGSGASFAAGVSDTLSQIEEWSEAITRVKLTLSQEFPSGTNLHEGQMIPFTSNRLGLSLTMAIAEMQVQGAPGGEFVGMRPLVLEA